MESMAHSHNIIGGLRKRQSALTAQNLQRLTDAFSEIGDARSVVSVASGTAARTAADRQPATQPFLKRKADIEATLNGVVLDIDGGRREIGVVRKLETLRTKVTEKNVTLDDLPHDVTAVVADLQRVSQLAKTEIGKIPSARVDEVSALEEALVNIQRQKNSVYAQVSTLTEQMEFKVKQAMSAQRSAYQTRRWKKDKMSQAFIKGGSTVPLAKWLAEQIHQAESETPEESVDELVLCVNADMNPDAENFDVTKMTLFTKENCDENSQTQQLWWSIKALLDESAKTYIKDKVAAMKTELTNHEQWPGAMGRITDCFASNLEGITHFGARDSTKKGAECWLLGSRIGALRMHPGGVPIPGTPTIIVAESGPLLIHGIRMKSFLDQGIAVSDYEKHQSTASGQENIKNSTAVLAWTGDSVYVPAGWYWSVIAASTIIEEKAEKPIDVGPKSKAKAKTKATPPSSPQTFGMAVVVPIFSPNLWKQTEANERAAIVAVNTQHFQTKQGRAMWTERQEAFDAVYTDKTTNED